MVSRLDDSRPGANDKVGADQRLNSAADRLDSLRAGFCVADDVID